jgi:hypothetical protein
MISDARRWLTGQAEEQRVAQVWLSEGLLMNTSWVALAATASLTFGLMHPAHAGPAQVDQALKMMLASCQIANASMETKRTPEGRLDVVITLSNGQRRGVSLVKSDMDSFMAGAVEVKARASLPVIQCMDPHLDDVIATLPMLPDRPAALPPPPAPAYVPPALPAVVAPSPAPMQPARPPLPSGGELPVGVVNGTVAPVAAAAPSATVAGGRLAASVSQCKGMGGNHVVCDIKVSNRSGQDAKLIIQGGNTIVLGEEGTKSTLYSVRMGEGNHYPGGNEKELRLDLIADASPTLQFHFYYVPEALLSIKRLEVTMGARLGTDAEMQKFLFANVPIQGR